MKTVKTTIQSYYYDTKNPDEKAAYKLLCSDMAKNGIKCFTALGKYYFSWCKEPKVIELETKHLFNNQWNTTPIEGISEKGLRVFDWAEDYIPEEYNKYIKKGHYIVITDEIRNLRNDRLQCGYTGHQIIKNDLPEHGFNLNALTSEYLTENELHLIRYQSINDDKRAQLTEKEKSFLMPLFIEAQIKCKKEKIEQGKLNQQSKIIADYEKAIADAKAKKDGFQWLLDNDFNLSNWIYYSHTKIFTFGWRADGVDKSLADEMEKRLIGFPAKYEIKVNNY